MKTIIITGGASGIGKGLSLYYLKNGDRVIAVGSSVANGNALLQEAEQVGARERVVYLQANLSLVSENERIIEEIKSLFDSVDTLILCASKHNKSYFETTEGFESSFALDYLSRFVLGYGLKNCIEKSDRPIIMNICGTGMKGVVNWDDLQHKNSFNSMKVMMHGSRLNELSGVSFTNNDTVAKIKYILYNPMAVKTPGMMEFGGMVMKLAYKFIGKPVDNAILPIINLLDNPPPTVLSAFKEHKQINTDMTTFDPKNADKLLALTEKLLEQRKG